MDPYLEAPALWEGFHNALMTYVRNELMAVLPQHYVAVLEMRIYLDVAEEAFQRVADVEIVQAPRPRGAATGTAVLSPESRSVWIELPTQERREAFVTIRHLPEQRHVATIELLSPSNKRGGPGRTAYLKKQDELVRAQVNLVEIDLLRRGNHTLLASERELLTVGPLHYLASVYRAHQPTRVQVFPWTVRDAMPDVPVPLLEKDADVKLALQRAFTRNYDEGGYERLLDYAVPADPPLLDEEGSWADELLRARGLRQAAAE